MWGLVVKSVAEMFANFFNWRTETAKNCSALEVIKDKQKTMKKSEGQEDLLYDMAILLQKYLNTFDKKDRIRARVYIRKVKKVN